MKILCWKKLIVVSNVRHLPHLPTWHYDRWPPRLIIEINAFIHKCFESFFTLTIQYSSWNEWKNSNSIQTYRINTCLWKFIFIINAKIWKRGTKIEIKVNYVVQLKLKSLRWSKHLHSFINYYLLSIYFKILMYKSVRNSWNLFYRNMGKYQQKYCFALD